MAATESGHNAPVTPEAIMQLGFTLFEEMVFDGSQVIEAGDIADFGYFEDAVLTRAAHCNRLQTAIDRQGFVNGW